jgi:TRAP-type mannitol/chloroaromatic compound transport system permease large subunit
MRVSKTAVMIVGLVLCCGQTSAQPSRPSYSADGLYNLANSYARDQKAGLAVLNYERAALMAPGDPDIIANLEYVRASAQVPVEPPSRFARIVLAVSPTLAAAIGVMGIIAFGLGLLRRKRASRFDWSALGGVVLGGAMIALTVSNAMLMWPRMHEAVILSNQTPARVSPVLMGDAAFVLREAETVTVIAGHEDFILVRARNGRTGWIARANLATVVPQLGGSP